MKLFVKKALSYFPSRLPTGMTEFDNWSNSIIELSGQFADVDSMKFVLADMIQRLGASKTSKYTTMLSYVPKNHFVQGLAAAAAKQIAAQVFFDIKTKQLEKQQEQQQAEAGNSDSTKETSKNTTN